MTTQQALPRAIITLMNGVVYREADEETWSTIQRSLGPLLDHFASIGVEVVVDDIEGYAYLRSRPTPDDEAPLPRLIHRRSLSYPLSVLLVLLRKRLSEFEAADGSGRLVLSLAEITDMVRIFTAESTNEARLVDQVKTTIGQAATLSFLAAVRGEPDHWEVRRILKAYVDAETLSDFDARLRDYAAGRAGLGGDAELSAPVPAPEGALDE